MPRPFEKYKQILWSFLLIIALGGLSLSLHKIEESNLSLASIFSYFESRMKQNDFKAATEKTKKSLVNIVCLSKNREIRPLSGSGVIVSKDGLIITNAHIAQYFLVKDYLKKDSLTCTIRGGNPAKPLYKGDLVYISPEWVRKNAWTLTSNKPTGTGENDFAFLKITGRIDNTALPSSFDYLPILVANQAANNEVLASGYGAGTIGGIALDRDLYAISSVVKVSKVQSFNGLTRDFLLLKESPVGEHGSSGGAVVDKNGNLVGLIATVRKNGDSYGALGSILFSHIEKNFENENTGIPFLSFLKDASLYRERVFDGSRRSELLTIYSKVLPSF